MLTTELERLHKKLKLDEPIENTALFILTAYTCQGIEGVDLAVDVLVKESDLPMLTKRPSAAELYADALLLLDARKP